MCYSYVGVNMKIVIDNKTYDIEMYNNPLKRLVGFMFKKNIDKIICFKHCNSIHTFFMKCDIAVLMFDKNLNLLHIERCMKKNKVLIKKGVYYTIELNPNLIEKNSKVYII